MDDKEQREIASQGGQRVKELVEAGKEYEREHGMHAEEDDRGSQRTRGGTREQHAEAGNQSHKHS